MEWHSGGRTVGYHTKGSIFIVVITCNTALTLLTVPTALADGHIVGTGVTVLVAGTVVSIAIA